VLLKVGPNGNLWKSKSWIIKMGSIGEMVNMEVVRMIEAHNFFFSLIHLDMSWYAT
jgi:hypothetical protein